MAFLFSDADLDRLATTLGVAATREGAVVRFALAHAPSGRRLALELTVVDDGDGEATLLSVYGPGAFLQLHGCTGFVASEEMGEAIFFAREAGRVSGLVVEREAGCSLYAHVREALLSADFTRLPPEVMMAAVALSMAEPSFE